MTSGRDHVVAWHGPGTLLRRQIRADADGMDVVQEAALLSIVAQVSPLRVPRVVRVLPDAGAMVMERLPGRPLLGSVADLAEPVARRLGDRLGELVAALAGVPHERVRRIVPVEPSALQEHHDEAARTFDALQRRLPDRLAVAVGRFLDRPLPVAAPRLVLCHHDLGAEHVLVGASPERVTGIIDWSDAAIGDPALDLGLVWRDLGAAGLAAALARVVAAGAVGEEERRDLMARAGFYARVRALEDLAHGLETGQRAYADNATRALARLS